MRSQYWKAYLTRLMNLDRSEFSQDFLPYQYQVAGHNAKNDPGSSGILKHKDGYLLKPVTKLPQGDNEISFYERLNNDVALFPLKKYVPEYFGCLSLNVNNKEIKFIKLKDVVGDYFKPCMMDVKIGKQTWEPNATLEKRRAEDDKYTVSKKEFGFCITGYYTHNLSSGELIKFGKEEGKRLNRESTFKGFREFFNHTYGFHSIAVNHMIKQLEELLEWWKSQTVVHMYASSILLVYDISKVENVAANVEKLEELATNNSWVKIYMIDFAHVVPANNLIDSNYIFGLSNLISVLKNIM